jgi:hypothetical protein
MRRQTKTSNGIDYGALAIPKGERRSTQKGREDREEAAVIKKVRPQVVGRDGYCRLQAAPQETRLELFGACEGPSEWSHYNETHRRSKTMGRSPETRHMVAHSMMLCRKHSQMYDQNQIRIKELTERGCDGPIRASREGRGVWEEAE